MSPFESQPGARLLGCCLLVAAPLALAACSSGTREAALTPAVAVASGPTSLAREQLVGRWGVASFHNEKDRRRTEAQARAECKSPYVIAKGPTDGVMMHVADDPKLYELKLKGGAGGKTYLGFEAPAGAPDDREILSASSGLVLMRFVEPEISRRYGTFVYARCA